MTATQSDEEVYDVVVVGAGNAGFSAASTAAETLRSIHASKDSTAPYTPKVLLLEKAPHASAGGNTFYTAGAYRFCFESLSDLRPILSHNGQRNIPDSLADKIEMAPYTDTDFHTDLKRVTGGRADPELAEVLIGRSREAVNWIADNGGQWELSFHRQAYEVDGRFKFWGGLVVCFAGGGKGLVDWHKSLAERLGVEVRYDTPVIDLLTEDDSGTKVIGVRISQNNNSVAQNIYSHGGVILATGGFQANPSLRTQWLGEAWTTAYVRGSSTNTGDGHTMTLLSPTRRIHAKSAGHYTGCHSVCWDANAPRTGGDRHLTNQYTKSGYPLGIMVNAQGKRFVDEGSDLRNYTYAIFGREVLAQPGGVAWQVWDSQGSSLLRKEEYDDSVTQLLTADTLSELADKLSSSGLTEPQGFLGTINDFNAACSLFQENNLNISFDPAKKDGLSTQDLPLPKSNWARPIAVPPYTAVKVTCGITFTFGGVAVEPQTAEVQSEQGGVVEGLYCCGELMGGLFWGNYPGGSGLTAGTVFGRIAGAHAARRAGKERKKE